MRKIIILTGILFLIANCKSANKTYMETVQSMIKDRQVSRMEGVCLMLLSRGVTDENKNDNTSEIERCFNVVYTDHILDKCAKLNLKLGENCRREYRLRK